MHSKWPQDGGTRVNVTSGGRNIQVVHTSADNCSSTGSWQPGHGYHGFHGCFDLGSLQQSHAVFCTWGVGFFHKSWEWKYRGFDDQSFFAEETGSLPLVGCTRSDISSTPSTYSRDGHQQTSSYEVRCRNRHCHYEGSVYYGFIRVDSRP